MGNRGSSGGPALGNTKDKPVKIISTTDVWSYRHRPDNESFVDEINMGVRNIQSDFPDIMQFVKTVSAAELAGMDRQRVLGFYGQGEVALNQNYTNIDKMNRVYDAAVSSGYHPGRGDKSGTQAVALHEMGHALTDHIAQKMGITGPAALHQAAKRIVDAAYRATKGTGGTKAWAGSISGYAQESNAECIAEAVADHYCNGSNASAASKAIFEQLKKHI